MKAATWYLENGYQVFFPAVTGEIADFVAYRPGERPLLVQVKTAHYITASGHKYLQLRIGRTRAVKCPSGTTYVRDWDVNRAEDHFDELLAVYENRMWRIPIDEFPVGKKTLYFDRGAKAAERMGYNSERWEVH